MELTGDFEAVAIRHIDGNSWRAVGGNAQSVEEGQTRIDLVPAGNPFGHVR
jgi:hypothetical protein